MMINIVHSVMHSRCAIIASFCQNHQPILLLPTILHFQRSVLFWEMLWIKSITMVLFMMFMKTWFSKNVFPLLIVFCLFYWVITDFSWFCGIIVHAIIGTANHTIPFPFCIEGCSINHFLLILIISFEQKHWLLILAVKWFSLLPTWWYCSIKCPANLFYGMSKQNVQFWRMG